MAKKETKLSDFFAWGKNCKEILQGITTIRFPTIKTSIKKERRRKELNSFWNGFMSKIKT